METIRVYYHDRCFDGAVSAAILSRFLHDYYYPQAKCIMRGLLYRRGFDWSKVGFVAGDENAIVDFRYCDDRRVTWWFDHHETAFVSTAESSGLRERPPERFRCDTKYSSCSQLIGDFLKEEYGYSVPEHASLIRAADVFDGAKYSTPESSLDLSSPYSRLKMVIESPRSAKLRGEIIRMLRYNPVQAILDDPKVEPLHDALLDDQLRSFDLLVERMRTVRNVAYADLSDTGIEVYNRMLPYLICRGADYSVVILTSPGGIKLSLGSSPWTQLHAPCNLAEIASVYGGGGHAKAAGIVFGSNEVECARSTATAIVHQLARG